MLSSVSYVRDYDSISVHMEFQEPIFLGTCLRQYVVQVPRVESAVDVELCVLCYRS